MRTSSSSEGFPFRDEPPPIPDHEVLRCIGKGAYGEVWMARGLTGALRAVKPGLIKVIASFEREQKIRVHVSFATAPEILERFSAGEAADIVVAPAEALDRIEGSSRKIENRTSLGRIGVGVFVRSGVG